LNLSEATAYSNSFEIYGYLEILGLFTLNKQRIWNKQKTIGQFIPNMDQYIFA